MRLASRCQCGAVTVEHNGQSFSMKARDLSRYFPGLKGKRALHVGSCDYCVNHWGVDLCGCGSGQKFGECNDDFPECRRPAQSIEEGIDHCYSDAGGWA